MPRPSLCYRITALVARAALPLIALGHARLRAMIRERKLGMSRLRALAARGRFPHPTIVIHAASAGELRQLEPVLRRLRERHPGWRIIVTWFSASGRAVAETFPADIALPLPFDTARETGAWLDHARPAIIVIGKLDLWPELAWQAERRGIPVALVGATVRFNSSRLRWPARPMLHPAYASLTAAGAISDDDAERLIQLGVPRNRIAITGDPRYDAVIERLEAATPVARDPSLLVAGSTWPVDELLLLQAFAEVRQHHPAARLLLIPHQPTAAVLERITGLARALALPAPDTSASPASALSVDLSVGGLALSYRAGGLAYVGGGFNLSGPHSVLEPAATGAPVVIGSMSTTREAHLLESAGGLVRLDNDGAMREMPAVWTRLLQDHEGAAAAGSAAKRFVEEGRGAAAKSVGLIEEMVRIAGEKGG